MTGLVLNGGNIFSSGERNVALSLPISPRKIHLKDRADLGTFKTKSKTKHLDFREEFAKESNRGVSQVLSN